MLSQNFMNLGPQSTQNRTIFLATLHLFCIPFYCCASHMVVRKQNSNKFRQMVGDQSRSR